MNIEAKINELGYTLPEAPAPTGSYVNFTRSGDLLFLAGGIPPVTDEFTGKVWGRRIASQCLSGN